jgi:hypothetical protein
LILCVLSGDSFLEGLLVNGWLSKLAFLSGQIEKPVAIWAFNTSKSTVPFMFIFSLTVGTIA